MALDFSAFENEEDEQENQQNVTGSADTDTVAVAETDTEDISSTGDDQEGLDFSAFENSGEDRIVAGAGAPEEVATTSLDTSAFEESQAQQRPQQTGTELTQQQSDTLQQVTSNAVGEIGFSDLTESQINLGRVFGAQEEEEDTVDVQFAVSPDEEEGVDFDRSDVTTPGAVQDTFLEQREEVKSEDTGLRTPEVGEANDTVQAINSVVPNAVDQSLQLGATLLRAASEERESATMIERVQESAQIAREQEGKRGGGGAWGQSPEDTENFLSDVEAVNNINESLEEDIRQPINEFAIDSIATIDEHMKERAMRISDNEEGLSSTAEVISTMGQGASSIAQFVGITALTKNPTLASAYLGSLAATPVYNDAREQGMNPRDSFRAASKTAVANMVLERIGGEALLGANNANRLVRGFQGSVGEMLTESSQEVATNVIRQTDLDQERPTFSGIGKAAVGASVPSFLLSALTPGTSAVNSRDMLINQIQNTSDVSREEAAEQADIFSNTVSVYRDALARSLQAGENVGLTIEEQQGDGEGEAQDGEQVDSGVDQDNIPASEQLFIQERRLRNQAREAAEQGNNEEAIRLFDQADQIRSRAETQQELENENIEDINFTEMSNEQIQQIVTGRLEQLRDMGIENLSQRQANEMQFLLANRENPQALKNAFSIAEDTAEGRTQEGVGQQIDEERAAELENVTAEDVIDQGVDQFTEQELAQLSEEAFNQANRQVVASDMRTASESQTEQALKILRANRLRGVDQSTLNSIANRIRTSQFVQEAQESTGISIEEEIEQAETQAEEGVTEEPPTPPEETAEPTEQEVDQEVEDEMQQVNLNQEVEEALEEREQETIEGADDDVEISDIPNIQQIRELREEMQSLQNAVDNHPARGLGQYANSDGQLPTDGDGVFVNNTEEIVEEYGFENEQALRDSFEAYESLRSKLTDIENALQNRNFSANQLLQRVRQAEQRGVQEGRQQRRQELVQEWRQQQELQDNLLDALRDYARSNLQQEGNIKSAISMVNNVAQMRTTEGQKREWARSMSRIDNMIDQEQKRRLQKQIKSTARRVIGSPSVDVGVQQRAEDLLSDLDLTGRTQETQRKLRELRSYVEQQQTEGNEVVSEFSRRTLEMLERAYKRPFEEIPVNDLRNVYEKLVRLESVGRQRVETRERLWEREKRHMMDELEGNTEGMGYRQLQQDKSVVDEKGLTLSERFRNSVRRAMNTAADIDRALLPMDVIFDKIDGSPGTYDGANYRIFKRTIDADWVTYLNLKEDILQSFKEKANELEITDDTRWEQIGFVAAREQEGGIEKLQNLGYTEEEINQVELDPDQREMLDWMRDKMEEQFPMVQDLMRRLFNERVERVDNYFTFMTDWDKMEQTSQETTLEETAMPMAGAFKTKKPEMGFTKSRTGAGEQKIKLHAAEIFQKHMDNVAYLRAMGRDLKQLFEIANSDQYQEMAGEVGQSMVVDWLDTIARRGNAGQQSRFWDSVRNNVGSAILGFKASTVIIQPSAFMDGAGRIGATKAVEGANKVLTNSDYRDFLMRFPELRERMGGETAIRDIVSDGWLDNLQEKGYRPMQFVDKMTALSIAAGAYEQKMAELGNDVDISGEPNQEAMQYAQLQVRRSQSTGMFKDVPQAISRGKLTGSKTLDKMLLQFQNFIINQWSEIRYDAMEVGIKNKDAKHAANIMFWKSASVAAATGLRMAERHLMSTIFGDDEEEEEDNELLTSMMYEVSGKVPFLGNMYGMIMYDGSPMPVMDQIRSVASGINRVATGKRLDTKLRGFNELFWSGAGLTGIPGSFQAQNIIDSLSTQENVDEIFEGGGGLQTREDADTDTGGGSGSLLERRGGGGDNDGGGGGDSLLERR